MKSQTIIRQLTHYIIYSVIPYIYVASLLLSSCNNKTTTNNGYNGDTITFKYAEHISAVRHDGYIDVKLNNPWKSGTILHHYALINHKDSGKVTPPTDATIIYTPISRAIVTTSPHCRLLFNLGAGETIKGVCDLAYITQQDIQQRTAKGIITDCGNSMSPTIERIISLSPDAMFLSPFEGSSHGHLENIGTPIVECADYMETSALGRAEWMRFYAMLVGKENIADSLFATIESNYNNIAKQNKKEKNHPKVITERVTSGVWYCPGGNSSMAKLIKDAGGDYIFADDTHSGSLNLSPEMVINKAINADIWLFIYYGNQPLTRNQLNIEYGGYKTIKAFKNGNIYECNGKSSTYFEEISFRPDYLLTELTHIFYPKSNNTFYPKSNKLRYYQRIKE